METNNEKVQEAFIISGDWKLQSKLLRRRFPQLTAFDIEFVSTKENDLLIRIEKRLNKKRSEVIDIINKTLTNKFINNLKIQYHE